MIWQWLVQCPDSISFLAAAAFVVALCWVRIEEARSRGCDSAGTDRGE